MSTTNHQILIANPHQSTETYHQLANAGFRSTSILCADGKDLSTCQYLTASGSLGAFVFENNEYPNFTALSSDYQLILLLVFGYLIAFLLHCTDIFDSASVYDIARAMARLAKRV